MKLKYLTAGALLASVLVPGVAMANITIIDATGGYSAGIGPDGELYDSTTGIGLRNPDGSDYIRPGSPRDSWGIASSAGSAYADYQSYGTDGIASTLTTGGGTTATTTTLTNIGLTVGQVFSFFAPNILSIQHTITNTTGADQTGVVFRRDVDFDVPPTTFRENTTGPLGTNPAVVGASYYGFENPNPATAFGFSCLGGCNRTGDLGAGIDLALGTLTAGQSITFAYYYGINQPGQTLNQLFAQSQTLGLSYLIGTQSSENGQYPNLGVGSAILGVSNLGTIAAPAVPEPATWAMMIGGFGFIGASLRRRRSAVAKFA